MKRKWVYGPVLSRRFGLSLGVDLVPAKLCSYDCVYCQVGRTTKLATEPSDWVSVEEVAKDVKEAVLEGGVPDVVTLAGSGEPTLYGHLGDLMKRLKEVAGAPVLLLTNGSLFYRPEVVKAALEADILAPSLDAGDPDTFRKINRPHQEVTFQKMLHGLVELTHAFKGTVRLEVMLVKGLNDSVESLQGLSKAIATLRVDRIDINTPVRPVRERDKMVCPRSKLEEAARTLGPKAVIVAAQGKTSKKEGLHSSSPEVVYRRVRETILRRPCTATEIGEALGLRNVEVLKVLTRLRQEKVLVTREAELNTTAMGDEKMGDGRAKEVAGVEGQVTDAEVYYFVED